MLPIMGSKFGTSVTRFFIEEIGAKLPSYRSYLVRVWEGSLLGKRRDSQTDNGSRGNSWSPLFIGNS